MKRFLIFLSLLFVFHFPLLAQNLKDSSPVKKDNVLPIQRKKQPQHVQKIKDTSPGQIRKKNIDTALEQAVRKVKDSINKQTVKRSTDTVKREIRRIPVLTDSSIKNNVNRTTNEIYTKVQADTLRPEAAADTMLQKQPATHPIDFEALIAKNKYINVKDTPIFILEQPREVSGKEFLFYTLCVVLLILGIFRTVFAGYFKNLFRVYFNTSLRQTQLSDQLEQAKLPSFILNIFFAITAGIYIWLLFRYYHPPRLINTKVLLPFCIIAVAALYFIKFCILKFMGWISDIKQSTNKYIFAIFLVNKITGIILVPIIILLAFATASWRTAITNGSFIIIGLFFLSRYFKSYGALDKKVKINPFHFIIYIAGGEIIPLFLLYKLAVDYLI